MTTKTLTLDAYRKKQREDVWLRRIQLLEAGIARRHWSVEYCDAPDYAWFTKKTIAINTHHTPEMKFYILTHEFGHLLISQKKNYFHKHFQTFTKAYGNITYRVAVVEEEVAAWEAGREWVIENIGAEALEDKKYWITRASMLSTYMTWVAGRKVTNACKKRNAKKHNRRTTKSRR